MKLVSIAAVLLVSSLIPLAAQSTSQSPIIPVIGTVKAISGDQIIVDSGKRIITVTTNGSTEVWKGKTTHDLSLVQVGDRFSARCRADSSGRIVAENISLNIVNFFGVITKVCGDNFEMLTNPDADPQSAYVKKNLSVIVDADTIFDGSAKDDLKFGREVQLVGLDLKNGMIRATRLTVYENKRPVRMGSGKVLQLDGTVK